MVAKDMIVIVLKCINVSNKYCTTQFQGARRINKMLLLKLCNTAALGNSLLIGCVLSDNL